MVIGWKTGEGAENLNGIEIVSKDDHARTTIRALGGIREGAEDAESLEVENGGNVGVHRGG